MLHIKQNFHFYTVALAYKTSLILQAQGVRRTWGDNDTLPIASCAYEYNYVVQAK